jgi:hypothetical protein
MLPKLDAEMLAYLSPWTLTEETPGIYLDWHWNTIEEFIHFAAQSRLHRPSWFLRPGPLSSSQFLQDIMTPLRKVAGGSYGNKLLAPNSFSQHLNVLHLLKTMELDLWMQSILHQLPIPKDPVRGLATVYSIVGPLASQNPRPRYKFTPCHLSDRPAQFRTLFA